MVSGANSYHDNVINSKNTTYIMILEVLDGRLEEMVMPKRLREGKYFFHHDLFNYLNS
jgi:hypothetical protein